MKYHVIGYSGLNTKYDMRGKLLTDLDSAVAISEDYQSGHAFGDEWVTILEIQNGLIRTVQAMQHTNKTGWVSARCFPEIDFHN